MWLVYLLNHTQIVTVWHEMSERYFNFKVWEWERLCPTLLMSTWQYLCTDTETNYACAFDNCLLYLFSDISTFRHLDDIYQFNCQTLKGKGLFWQSDWTPLSKMLWKPVTGKKSVLGTKSSCLTLYMTYLACVVTFLASKAIVCFKRVLHRYV